MLTKTPLVQKRETPHISTWSPQQSSGAPKSQWASNHLKRFLTLARASMQDSPIPQQMEMGIQL